MSQGGGKDSIVVVLLSMLFVKSLKGLKRGGTVVDDCFLMI